MEKEIIINGIKYIPEEQKINSPIKIAILQRGWNVIGRYSEDGENIILTDAYVIRRWGTTEGLGQLALKGKQTDTVLDKCGTVRFNKLTTIGFIDCDEKIWDELI